MPLTCKILQRPLSYTPGTTWNYSTYDAHLASAFFTAKTGQTIEDYGNTHLFNYLGINTGDMGWTTASGTTPQTFGGGLLAIRSRDLIKIGELVLYNGVWDGQTLISPEWMSQSLTSQGDGDVAIFGGDNKPSGSHHQAINYAWQWWLRSGTDEAGLGAIVASGLGGQQMHIIRSKGLVVLVTSGFSTQSELQDPTRQDKVRQFIRNKILAKLSP
jgi:CubicO group peptidase (beta-lactamase class C family)